MQSSLSSSHKTPISHCFPNNTKHFPSIANPIKKFHLKTPLSLKLRSQFDTFSTKLRNPISIPTTHQRFLNPNLKNETKYCTQILCGISSDSLSAGNKSSFRVFVEGVSDALSTRGMVMPFSGFFISKLLGLPSHYAAGLILVGCCPGGTASHIVTYIAHGNVALSVLMTAASTFSAVIMTPYLTAKLAGQYVAVDAAGLLVSTLQVVLLPVLAGAFLNQYFQGLVKFVSPVMPPVAVVTVAVLCGNAIAQSSSAILSSGVQVVLACCLLHSSGFFFGYMLARLLRIDISSARTISIEVGMQNSVLGLVLANQHFGNPLTAVPCAVSSVCHSIIGSALAGIWRYSTHKEIQQ